MVVGFTSVVGDLFHCGHVAMVQECRKYCDYLILAVMAGTADREWKQTPTQSLFERFFQVWNCKGVDEIYACEDEKDLLLAIKVLTPRIQIRFVGDDYRDKDFTGKQYCLDHNIKLVYNKREHGLSSSELKERIREEPL